MGREGDLLLMEELTRDGLVGVLFVPDQSEAVRQWVQDRSAQTEVIATSTRLYLPVYGSMTTLDEGDTVWFDPTSDKPNAFSVERA